MATSTKSHKVNTQAVHRWLCTQRRLAIEKGVHVFKLAVGGKCTTEQAIRFLGNCPEVVYATRQTSSGVEFIVSRPKSA
jgi:hypothetical protein